MTIQSLAFAETRWQNAEHRERTKADSALVLNVQRISRFLIDCKKSQFFLWKIFEIEHAEYCCGFNFKTFSKITIEKLEIPSCRDTAVDGKAKTGQSILRPPTAAQIF